MKKIFFLFLLLLATAPFSLQAQHFQSAFRIGINAAQINGDGMAGFHKGGAVIGLQVAYPFNERWSGAFEMLWSQKGSKVAIDSNYTPTPPTWFMLRLNYVEVPVMAIFKLNNKVSFQGGLGWGYLFNTLYEPFYGGETTADFMKKTEISITFGASWRFANRWSLYARYSNSLLPVNKGSSIYAAYYYGAGLYNIIASFGLLYHFQDRDAR